MHTEHNKTIEHIEQKKVQQSTTKPNEQGNLYVASHIKIHDPETKQVFVSQRG